jgi:NTE family protein
MEDRRLTLALGGGAAKGLAHIGVLRGIEEDGITVAAVAGTSMGSIIGALAAQGLGARELDGLFRSVDWVRLGRIMLSSVSGAAFHDMLRESFGGVLIEDLEIPFAAVCGDLDTGEMVILDSGDLAEAVCASSSIPGILPSRTIGDRRLVDGAVIEPVPVTAATAMATSTVLAVSVVRPPGRREQRGNIMTSMPVRLELPPILRRVEAWLRRQRNGNLEDEVSARVSRWEAVFRSFHIMQHRLATCSRIEVPMIEPRVGGFGWFDFHRVEEIIVTGYEAYREWARDFPPRTPSSPSPRNPAGTSGGRF